MKTIFSLLIILCAFSSFAQEDKINQRDDKGEKHGKWIIWLDDNWAHTDSAKAVYKRYTYYEHGSNVYMMGPIKSKKGRLECSTNNIAQAGKIVLLDGEYKSYNEKGKLSIVFLIEDGWFVKYTEYRSDGTLDQIFDYTKHYEDQEHSWLMQGYKKDGSLKWEYYIRRNADGTWPRGRPN
jgi:hypothetical protein